MTIGSKIKLLRTNKGITQEQLADKLHISGQAVSKWENETSSPDITILPAVAEYFGITMDELFDYKLNAFTNKEKFIKFMAGNGILTLGDYQLKSGVKTNYFINTEQFTSNVQISKIGEFFADCIKENNIEFDAIIGLAYQGIAFSVSTACALFQKYGMTVNYCHDRLIADNEGRKICGYTPKDGDKVVIIADIISTGEGIAERIDKIMSKAKVEIAAVVVIANRYDENTKCVGERMLEEKYGTKIYSIVTHNDIQQAISKHIV